MKSVAIAAALVLASAGAYAQTVTVERALVTNMGTYSAEIASTRDSAGAATGAVHTVTGVRFIRPTTQVRAELNMHFGFQLGLVGRPAGAAVKLKKVTRFPAGGVRNPARQETFYQQERMIERTIGASPTYTGYGFDEEWELVPGVWTFEIWHEDRKIAEQSFTVTLR